MITKRAAGLLLHITSLPSKYGIGDLGPDAYAFADFLSRAKQKYWQLLPINPFTFGENPYSPYNALSALAGNTILISPDNLYRDGLLTKSDLRDCPRFPDSRVDFPKTIAFKTKLLDAAYERFKTVRNKSAYQKFCRENAFWLDDYSLFISLCSRFEPRLWCDWPAEIRDRDKNTIKKLKIRLWDSIEREKFLQYIFFKQWFSLKSYCNRLGIGLIGDVPIYVAWDSADVWANPDIFKLDRSKRPRFISGVPPDYFSKTGQIWGNPVYDWNTLKQTRYDWWIKRIKHNLALFDIVRIDHFRGLVAFWQVPAGQKTAIKGKWIKGPSDNFFDTLFNRISPQSIIAEDLGYITEDVKKTIAKYNLAGMKVLQFAFDGNPRNTHLPFNHTRNCVVYTGTHDNNTSAGWFNTEIDPRRKQRLCEYLGYKPNPKKVHWDLIRLALVSAANLSILPLQDILGLDEKARMNHPGQYKNNWLWRLRPNHLTRQISKNLANLTVLYGRV